MVDTNTTQESILGKLKSKAMEMHTGGTEKIADASGACAEANETETSLLNRLKDKAMEVHAGVTEKIANVSDAGMEKLQEMMAEVEEISPFLCELGYTVEGIKVAIGLIPDISIDIGGMTKTMPEETYQRIMEEHKDKVVLVSIVKALQTISALQNRVHFLGMRSDNATITLGLPPKVSLNFKKTT
jgi:hypothetical protein